MKLFFLVCFLNWYSRPSFQEKLRELEHFIAVNGHMNPKTGTVYNWIKYQRLRRQAFPKRYGKKNRPMTQSEIDALDAIGFVWDYPSSVKSPGGK